MDGPGADRHGDFEPLSALHRVGRLNLRRVFLVVGPPELTIFRRELLGLTLRAHSRRARQYHHAGYGDDGQRPSKCHELSPLDAVPGSAAQFSGRNRSISAMRSRGLYGLARYAEAPASIARRSSPLSANDVTTTSGIFAVRGSARSRRVASSPDSLGNWTSMRMRSGSSRCATASPSSPSTASSKRKDVRLSSCRTIFRLYSLSSMWSTVRSFMRPLRRRAAAP